MKGFAGSQGDFLDPGGPTDLLRAVQQGLYRLGAADQPQRRRLFGLWTDGMGPRVEAADYAALVPALGQAGAALHLFGVGPAVGPAPGGADGPGRRAVRDALRPAPGAAGVLPTPRST